MATVERRSTTRHALLHEIATHAPGALTRARNFADRDTYTFSRQGTEITGTAELTPSELRTLGVLWDSGLIAEDPQPLGGKGGLYGKHALRLTASGTECLDKWDTAYGVTNEAPRWTPPTEDAAETAQAEDERPPYCVTITKPEMPTVYLGFWYQHQAEGAAQSLNFWRFNSNCPEGTQITWGATPDDVDPLPPVPTSVEGLIEAMDAEDRSRDHALRYPDLYARLEVQEGQETAAKLWKAACNHMDAEAEHAEQELVEAEAERKDGEGSVTSAQLAGVAWSQVRHRLAHEIVTTRPGTITRTRDFPGPGNTYDRTTGDQLTTGERNALLHMWDEGLLGESVGTMPRTTTLYDPYAILLSPLGEAALEKWNVEAGPINDAPRWDGSDPQALERLRAELTTLLGLTARPSDRTLLELVAEALRAGPQL